MSDLADPQRCSCCGHALAELHVSKNGVPVGWLVRVECQQCGTQTRTYYADTRKAATEMAVTAWNQRVLESMLRALLRQAHDVICYQIPAGPPFPADLVAAIDAALEGTP